MPTTVLEDVHFGVCVNYSVEFISLELGSQTNVHLFGCIVYGMVQMLDSAKHVCCLRVVQEATCFLTVKCYILHCANCTW